MNTIIFWLLFFYCGSALIYNEYQDEKRKKEFWEEIKKWRKGRSDE